MLFPTFTFFLFFAVVLILSWTLKKWPFWWRVFLLTASYIFYATINVRFVLLIFIVSLINFYSGLLIHEIDQQKKKLLLGVAVVINILILGFFKYYGFFQEGMQALLGKFGLSANFLFLNIILPVGLSFYILRAISYNVDIYRKKISPEISFLDLAIYIAFFPQLLAGPIMKADEFLPQLKNGGAKTIDNLQENFAFILSGLFKKVVVASYLTVNIVDDVFAVPQNHSQLAVLLAIYAYALVIYCDFSGYSDLAIGIAGLMGFKSPVNFNAPYLSVNFRDFWRRWHITFSNWLRDYVYIPLGGNRKGEIRTNFNLVITMLISGLWHGTGLNFVFWGFLHSLGLIASNIKEKFGMGFKGFLEKFEKLLSWFITFNTVCFFWIFFRAESISGAFAVIKQLFNWKANIEPIEVYIIAFIVLGFLIFALGKQIKKLFLKIEEKLPLPLQIIFISILVVIIIELGPDIIPPFIYFQF